MSLLSSISSISSLVCLACFYPVLCGTPLTLYYATYPFLAPDPPLSSLPLPPHSSHPSLSHLDRPLPSPSPKHSRPPTTDDQDRQTPADTRLPGSASSRRTTQTRRDPAFVAKQHSTALFDLIILFLFSFVFDFVVTMEQRRFRVFCYLCPTSPCDWNWNCATDAPATVGPFPTCDSDSDSDGDGDNCDSNATAKPCSHSRHTVGVSSASLFCPLRLITRLSTQAPPNSTCYFPLCIFCPTTPLHICLYTSILASTALHYTGICAHIRSFHTRTTCSDPPPHFCTHHVSILPFLHSSLLVASLVAFSYIPASTQTAPPVCLPLLSRICLPYTALRGLCIFRHACCASASIECWPSRPTHTLSLCFGLCLTAMSCARIRIAAD